MKKLTLLCLSLFVACHLFAHVPLFGHRGGIWGVENTEQCFRNGAKYFDGLETDVKVTRDGYFVCWHDDDLTRVGGTEANSTIANHTLAELQSLTLSQKRYGVQWTDAHLTTFSTYLDICAENDIRPLIELKWATGINSNEQFNMQRLMDTIAAHGLKDKAIILTSMKPCLQWIRNNATYKDMELQFLCYNTSFESSIPWAESNHTDIDPSTGAEVSAANIALAHSKGVMVNVWTVNTVTDYNTYRNRGIDYITTDSLRPCFLADYSGRGGDTPTPPTPVTPINLYVSEIYSHTAAAGTLPEDFPDGTNASGYNSAQQACFVDGVFYANDYATSTLLALDQNGFTITDMTGTPRHGICRDDAGNIILNASDNAAKPTKLRVYKHGTTTPVEITFSLPHTGQNNFPSAYGDIFSSEGGYVYFFPNGQKYVDVLHIANGELTDILSSSELSLTGSTASWVIPIGDDPMHFIYQVRAYGYYLYDKVDKGAYLATTAAIKAPARNTSIGGAYFTLDDHELFLYSSGTNYNGGFSIKDVTDFFRDIYSHDPIGSLGYNSNLSCGTFYWVERIDDQTCHLYQYCMGNGYAAYRVSTLEPDPFSDLHSVRSGSRHAQKLVRNGQLIIVRDGIAYSALGVQL